MKKMILSVMILVGISGAGYTQKNGQKIPAKKIAFTKSQAAKKSKPLARKSNSTVIKKSDTQTLISTASYPAFRSNAAPGRFTIADPTVNVLKQRAYGSDIRVSGSGIIGMPRSSYGFANGRITLIPGGARTSGTQTGSGSVGTGTSPGPAGSDGPAMIVNGKSPYAGTSIWSSNNGLTLYSPGEAGRRTQEKQ
jgi:hypothetical protein